MTSAEHWLAVQGVLDAVLELPPEARAERIAGLCGNDSRLRHDVERLVRACADAEKDAGFLRDVRDYASPVLADLESGDSPLADSDELRSRMATALEHRYRLGRELGSGGMAVVFLAWDVRHEREVAVKVMKPGLLAGVAPERFLREVRIVAGLAHPHILPLYDSGDAAGMLYHVSAYVEGESLRARLRREGALPVRDALRILRDVASALDYAHARGIVHRDIKPENVLLQAGHAVVADFGIARAFGRALQQKAASEPGGETTQEGIRLGTPAYMAPEQAAGNPAADLRADLYALGVVAYEMLSGQRPFTGNTPEELLGAQLTHVPPRLVREDVSTALRDLVRRLLAKRPEDRFQNAAQLLGELEQISSAETPSGPDRSAREEELSRPGGGEAEGANVQARAFKRGIIGVSTAVLVIALLLVVIIRARRQPPQMAAPLSVKTLAVAAFGASNRNAGEAVDRVLQIVADWITHGLLQTHLVNVVPVGALTDENNVGPGGINRAVLAAARAAGAGLLLLPSYQEVADTVFLSAHILKVPNGVVLRSVGPVPASRSKPLEGVEVLRQQTLGALATLVDERLANWSAAASQPTSFEAYQAFADGLAAFFDSKRRRDPYPSFRRAHQLDTTFTAPLLWALFRLNDLAASDSIKAYLEARRSRLPPWDQGMLDFMVRQNNEEGYQAFRRVVETAPQSEWLYMLAWTAMSTNRPVVAVRALQRLDPDRGWMRYWPSYWTVLQNAVHHLKRYDDELAVNRQAAARFPNEVEIHVSKAIPLAALGRTTELEHALEEISYDAIDAPVWRLTDAFEWLVLEMRIHGLPDIADRFVDRLIRQLEANEDLSEEELDEARMWLLMATNRWLEAAPLLEKLSAGDPENPGLLRTRARVAAFRGQSAEAERLAVQARKLDVESWPSRRDAAEGRHMIEMARLHAMLGNKDKAVGILKAAAADHRHPAFIHAGQGVELLADYPAFVEFSRRQYDDPGVLPATSESPPAAGRRKR